MVAAQPAFGSRSGARVDLALTLPVFLAYHLGVVFLKVKNASDPVTGPLLQLASGSRGAYLGLTLSIGLLFGAGFALVGRGDTFRVEKFVQIAIEGVVYALGMRLAADYVVGKLAIVSASSLANPDPLTGIVMSLGAGFYEELVFRVLLFGAGSAALVWLVVPAGGRPVLSALVKVAWALGCAALFSGVHYLGAIRDTFELSSFVFRAVLGVALTLIFVTRGFAAAVWAHALYDVWVLVL